MILITGTSGKLGMAAIHSLLKLTSEKNIVALIRDEKKRTSLHEKGIITRAGDYFGNDSLLEAWKEPLRSY